MTIPSSLETPLVASNRSYKSAKKAHKDGESSQVIAAEPRSQVLLGIHGRGRRWQQALGQKDEKELEEFDDKIHAL